MYFGGAMFDPNPRQRRRTSLGALLSSAGIFIGGLTIVAGVFAPWTSERDPTVPFLQNGLVGAGPWAVALLTLGSILIVASAANGLSPARRFNLGLQIFAIVVGATAFGIDMALGWRYAPRGPFRCATAAQCLFFRHPYQRQIGYWLTRNGAGIVIAAATVVLFAAGVSTLWARRRVRLAGAV